MSKHKLAKAALAEMRERCVEQGIDPNEAVEALLTWCIEDMKVEQGKDHTRSYVQYELDCVGSGDVYEIQRR